MHVNPEEFPTQTLLSVIKGLREKRIQLLAAECDAQPDTKTSNADCLVRKTMPS